MKKFGLIAVGFAVGIFTTIGVYMASFYEGNVAIVDEFKWTHPTGVVCEVLEFSNPQMRLLVHKSTEHKGAYGAQNSTTVTRVKRAESVIVAGRSTGSYMGRVTSGDGDQEHARRVCANW